MRSPAARPRQLRCAIYTRKSSEEGLKQDFNSLHAQREACEAYIKSQKHEGWSALPAAYDDGGYSGGTIERPGLQKVLADIGSGTIDVVVVYKVDRLTRSLTDFARIVELFDRHGVSFVSVTQAFNTTTSMGRLTLNVLLSFAQFEREVTGERIRDKIAASKKKGLWMGGFVPFGYRPNGRTLLIEPVDAKTVRKIFQLYFQLGSVLKVEAELARQGARTRSFTSAGGKPWGDRPFSRGHIYKLLSNPIYIGKIAHKGEAFDGQHEAIIDTATWDTVQAQLDTNAHEQRVRSRAKDPSLLADLLVDSRGKRLISTHAVKDGKRYRYYMTNPNRSQGAASWRLPAHDIEAAVIRELSSFLQDQAQVAGALAPLSLDPSSLNDAFAVAEGMLPDLTRSTSQQRAVLLTLVQQVRISGAETVIEIDLSALVRQGQPDFDSSHVIRVPISFRQQAGETKLVISSLGGTGTQPNLALVKAVARAYAWFEELCSGKSKSVTEIATREG